MRIDQGFRLSVICLTDSLPSAFACPLGADLGARYLASENDLARFGAHGRGLRAQAMPLGFEVRNALALYSITTNQAAIAALFRVISRYVGNLPPMPGVFPDYLAPVVRDDAGYREMVVMRWGMPPPPKFGGPPGRPSQAKGKWMMMTAGWTIQCWTPEEDVRLRRLAEEGRGAAVITARLKRSRAAIYARAAKLGITLKWAGAGLKAKRKR
jgi:hypothetical protein